MISQPHLQALQSFHANRVISFATAIWLRIIAVTKEMNRFA